MRTTKLTVLLLMVFLMMGCTFSNRAALFSEIELEDGNKIILNEVAMIDSLENEYIKIQPQEDNLLLVSVVEVMNNGDVPIDVSSYFDQTIYYNNENFDAKIFSLDGERIRKNRQGYVYLVSELPYETLEKIDSKDIQVELAFGDEEFIFKNKINNNYGLQENITTKYNKIKELETSFNNYWMNDLKGFQVFAKQRAQIKNYNQIYDWVSSTQKEYKSISNVLDIYLEEMGHIKLITPIYPDSNIKILLETQFLRNKLQAIIDTENTCSSHEGLENFLKNCQYNLDKAEEENIRVVQNMEKEILKERFGYRNIR